MYKKLSLILSAVMLLTACASMFSGTKEHILIRSEEKDSKIYLNDEYLGTDNAIAVISKKSLPDSVIRVSKKGCRDSFRRIDTKVNGLTFLGLPLDFGIFSILIIDWGVTGAVREATQTNYFISPICD